MHDTFFQKGKHKTESTRDPFQGSSPDPITKMYSSKEPGLSSPFPWPCPTSSQGCRGGEQSPEALQASQIAFDYLQIEGLEGHADLVPEG
jgi:hypothetical protein